MNDFHENDQNVDYLIWPHQESCFNNFNKSEETVFFFKVVYKSFIEVFIGSLTN